MTVEDERALRERAEAMYRSGEYEKGAARNPEGLTVLNVIARDLGLADDRDGYERVRRLLTQEFRQQVKAERRAAKAGVTDPSIEATVTPDGLILTIRERIVMVVLPMTWKFARQVARAITDNDPDVSTDTAEDA